MLRPTLSEIHSLNTTGELANFPQSQFRSEHQQQPEFTKERPALGNVIPALPTLYHEDGAINLSATQEIMQNYKNAGIQSVLIAGTTGESSLMNHEEQILYIQAAVQIAKKLGLQVVAGTGSNSTLEQNSLTQRAFEVGADAALLLAPYYLKGSPEAIGRHFWEALNEGPGIIYSISGRTGIQISLEIIFQLSEHPNFLGVKECDGQDRIKQLSDGGIQVWSGNDDQAPDDISTFGAFGVISVTANIHPEIMLAIATPEEQVTETIRWYSDRLAAIAFPQKMPNPGAIHSITEMQRRFTQNTETPATFRSPVNAFSVDQQQWLKMSLNQLGINTALYGENFQEFSHPNQIQNVQTFHTPRF